MEKYESLDCYLRKASPQYVFLFLVSFIFGYPADYKVIGFLQQTITWYMVVGKLIIIPALGH